MTDPRLVAAAGAAGDDDLGAATVVAGEAGGNGQGAMPVAFDHDWQARARIAAALDSDISCLSGLAQRESDLLAWVTLVMAVAKYLHVTP